MGDFAILKVKVEPFVATEALLLNVAAAGHCAPAGQRCLAYGRAGLPIGLLGLGLIGNACARWRASPRVPGRDVHARRRPAEGAAR
eukprot:6202404-Pleurochrysis_carterae.AAC.1